MGIDVLEKSELDDLFDKSQKLNEQFAKDVIDKITQSEKKKIIETVNQYIKKNDRELNRMIRAFLNKERDVCERFYLFKIGWTILPLLEKRLEGKDRIKIQKLIKLRDKIPFDKMDKLFEEIIWREKNNYPSYRLRKKFNEICVPFNLMMLMIIRQIFDATDLAKESEPTEEYIPI